MVGTGAVYPYCCDECGRGFRRNGDLTRHKTTHTGVKKFICPYCNKGFAQQSGLKTHINTHSGAKPHKCAFCDKAFGDPSSCTRHEKETHRITKPYDCPMCPSRIRRRGSFRAHLDKHVDHEYYSIYVSDEYLASLTVPLLPKPKKNKGRGSSARQPKIERTARLVKKWSEDRFPATTGIQMPVIKKSRPQVLTTEQVVDDMGKMNLGEQEGTQFVQQSQSQSQSDCYGNEVVLFQGYNNANEMRSYTAQDESQQQQSYTSASFQGDISNNFDLHYSYASVVLFSEPAQYGTYERSRTSSPFLYPHQASTVAPSTINPYNYALYGNNSNQCGVVVPVQQQYVNVGYI